MERNMKLSKAAVVIVAVALVAAIAAAVWFAHPDAPYVPSADSGAALGTAAPAEDGTVANQQTTVPSGYTGIYTTTDFGSVRSGGRGTNGSSAKYILMEDITVTSIDTTAWTGDDGNPWKGELNGNGHTITLSGTAEGEYYDNGGLFSVIGGGAYIHDLTLQVGNVRVNNNAGNANFGTIAGAASGNATIDNVYISLNKDSSSNNDTYLSSQGTSWLGGVLGKLDTSGTVEIKNTTVYNSAEGSNGFSATINKENGVYVGGFVGSIDKGSLKMTNVVYKADANAKISAIAINSTSWYDGGDNTTFVGGILGYHNEGSFELDGCIIDAAIGLSTAFRTVNGDTAHAGYILGQVDSNLTDTWSNIYMNSSNGTTWLDGNNETRGTAVRYDKSVFADIRFADGEKVAVAVGKQSPANAGSIPRTITQGADTSNISDAEIAGAITEGSGTAWLTIKKVNATTNVDMSVGDRVSTGSYNLTSPTISSDDGATYKGSKEYDGTAYEAPYITIGKERVNAWVADVNNADAGVKNFTYAGDGAFTGYQVATYANGDKYLVKDGRVYLPGTITIGGQSGQAFKLGNSFSYEITPASVTVTPNVPDDDLYTGNPMPALTATAVDSGGSPVEGSIKWDDPDATLISGKHSYAWTWTPNSSNYQTVTGSMQLEAFDRKIVSLTVQGDFKTKYIAYEPFDPTGVVVTATYSDGTSAALVNDEYEFKVVNGDKNRLVVGNDTVTVSLVKGAGATTTITIDVGKLAVGVPTAIEGLVYNGSEQTGVASSADGYYTLSGHNGTDADDYTATATLADTTNTRWNNEMADDTAAKDIEWSISPATATIEAVGTLIKTYDGEEVDPSGLFTAYGVNGETPTLVVTVTDDETILNADTYTVTASLASTETNYTADSEKITYTVNKKLVSGEIVADDLVYDGTDKGATFNGQLIGEDKVEIKYAGDRRNVTEAGFTATADLPSDNYAWADDAATSATFMILPKEITVTATSGSKEFAWIMASASELYELFELDGEKVNAEDKLIWKVNGEEVDMSDGNVSEIFDAKEYKIEIASADANYTLTGQTSTTYTITTKKVEKPTILDEREFTYNGTEQGFDIAGNADYTVTGTTEATNADDYTFTIALTDKINTEWTDNTSEDIVVEWSIMKMTIAGAVSAPADLSYDGNAKKATFTKTSGELFGEDAITISYNDGADTVNVTKQTITATASLPNDNYTWSEDSVLSASYEIKPMTVTIGRVHEDVSVDKYYDGEEVDPKTLFTAPNGADGQPLELEFTVDKQAIDGDKTILGVGTYNVTAKLAAGQDNYTADAIEVVYQIYKKNIEIPYDDNATTFEYTGTEQGFTIEESDYYTVTGVTNATDAGEYSFTIALTDKDNTEWANGANEDITVKWSITQATFKTVTPQFEEGAFDDLFTSDPLPMPTQVITDPAGVDGTFTWQDQQLIAGEKVYIWRFTAPNYGIYSGEKTITVSQAQLDHIEVSEVKTEYTAYDAFDKEGLIVTAYYDHGGDTPDPVQLTSGYTISVKDGGDIDKLSVKDVAVIVTYTDGEVTDTAEIAITVSKLLIDIPTAATDLVYNGSEQTGVAESADNYYAISGNVGTNADTYTATAMLIDTDNTEWKSGSTDNITIPWSIAPMTVSGEIVADDLIYDGTEKSATFNGQLIGEDTVEIKYVGERVDVTEDGFTVSVTLPSDGGQNYRFENGGQELTKTFKIEPKQIFLGQGNYTWGWIYGDSPVVADLGGNTNDETSFVRAYEDDGLTTPLDQGVNFSAEEKDNDLAQLVNAGEYTLVFTLVKGNYWADPYEVTVSVAKKAVSAAAVTITAPNTIYTGEEINAEVSVSVELVGDDKITIEYNSVDRVNVTGEEIIATAKLTDNYEWRSDDGIPQEAPSVTYTIQKADVIVDTSSISDVEWSTTSDMPELIAEDSQGNAIPGEFVWTPDKLSADIQDYAWVFTPDDGNNYNGTSGNVILNVAQAILESITVGIVTETEYESNDAFDRNDIVVTAIYDGGYVKIVDKEDYVLEFSSGSEYELQTGVITVTVSYTDGETKSATFEIVVAQEVTIEQVKEAINAMDKVTWQNASEYLDLKKRYNALDDADKDDATTAKLATLQAQYEELRDAAIADIEGAHQVTAKAVGKALAVAAGLAAAAVAAAIAKRRFI